MYGTTEVVPFHGGFKLTHSPRFVHWCGFLALDIFPEGVGEVGAEFGGHAAGRAFGFFFNLLPIPPLDGSRVVRNMLPYNAVQVYDRIGGWLSYLLMIFVGGFLLNLLLWPALDLVFSLLWRH